jgi:predicted RNase H-like nuclease (RuvC/YqgF family)
MRKWVTIAMVALVCLCSALYLRNKALLADNDRLTANQTALMQEAAYYETEAGKSAASVQKLELTISELKAEYKQVCRTAEELGVKVKRLQSAMATATKTEVKVITQVRDSIVYRDGVVDTLKAFGWQDAWVNVLGELKGRDVSLDVVSQDTLIQIVHRVPKRFLFFRWGTKAIRQEITSTNPHTKITYTEYIELK